MSYQYATLSDSKIRLLSLLPGRFDEPLFVIIIETDFSSGVETIPSYEALSYVWGGQETSQPMYITQPESSVCDTMNLGPNLSSALQHLRLAQSTRILWCDFICINQVDRIERAREVARMADIYRKASRTVVWLGPEADGSALAIKTIKYTGSQVQAVLSCRTWKAIEGADPKFQWKGNNVPYTQQELQSIQKLIARRWFKRLWVRQETTLAKASIVVAGKHAVSWTHLISTAAFLDSCIRLRGKNDTSFGQDIFNLFEFGCLESYHDLLDILHACRSCECTEDHDRVYGILGLLSSHQALTIHPDYSKRPKHVYQDLVIQCYWQHQRLNILTLCESAETPTWVPDLQNLKLGTGLHTRVVQYCWASGEAAASLVLLNDNTIETYGVKCGVLGKEISTPIDKKCGSEALKGAIVQIVRDHMGEDVSQWNESRLEILTRGLLGCLWNERTGRMNHSSLPFAWTELKKWVLEEPLSVSTDSLDEHESLVLVNHIARVLFHGDSCRWTQDGHLGLGFNAIREGDHLYTLLGCRRLMVLRKDLATGAYRVVGKFDHPGYNDGEALMGKLDSSWSVNYHHWLLASNRPRFVHEDGTAQWQDPRLEGIELPEGWCEGQDEHGFPYWYRMSVNRERVFSDPRLTYNELKARNVKIEKLVLI